MKIKGGIKNQSQKSRADSFISGLIALCASITLFNYIVYFVKLIIFPESAEAYIITVCVFAAVILPILFRKKIRKITGKLFLYLKIFFAAGLAFYVFSFVFMCGYIAVGSSVETPPEDLPDDTVFIIYGAKVNGSGNNVYPGSSLRKRLDYAEKLMHFAPESVCVVTGGKGADEAKAEGDVMRDYLISKGIESERIYVDSKARDTIENIEYSKEIIERELEDYKIACVSSDFHIPRIQILAKKYGLDAEYFYYAPCPNVFVLYTSLVREYMSYGKLILSGKL